MKGPAMILFVHYMFGGLNSDYAMTYPFYLALHSFNRAGHDQGGTDCEDQGLHPK